MKYRAGMEPLSKPLTDWLIKLQLCTRADLRRCQGRVRQLARDVPAFDSLWIDALVHARKLTAFQARLIESGSPERLAVGPCVLVDRLGHGTHATYLARHRQSRERCVLKLLALPEEQRAAALESLRQLVARTERLNHPGLVAPKSCLLHEQDLVTVSRYVAGPSLSQLLVRRGRFPARIVLALAKQLVDGLAAMEDCGIVHGDLRLSNLRLSSAGRIVMVDAGIAPAIKPELTIHARISPEHYDGIAPELIGTGNLADVHSEFYALGCLLWQLLAGRPPFPTGDPLAKLMAHQTKRVSDVRDIAPDTPAELAGIIKAFTEPDPARRPPSFRTFRARWGGPKRSHKRHIARFRALFNTAIPHIPAMTPEVSSGHWPITTAMLFLLTGATLFLMDAGAYTRLLAIPNQIEAYLNAPESESNPLEEDPTAEAETDSLKPLPPPDANGVIFLPDAGPYRGSALESVGQLTIRGPEGTRAEILLDDDSLRITAADVLLENVQFRRADSAKSVRPLLEVRSRSMITRNGLFQIGKNMTEAAPGSDAVGVEWKPILPAPPQSSRVGFEDCHFVGSGLAVHLADWPGQIVVKNCLKTGAGLLLDFEPKPSSPSNLQLDLVHLTLRGASGLLRCDVASNPAPAAWVIRAENCVWDLHPGSSSLIQAAGNGAGRFYQRFQLQGQNCLLNDSATVAAWWNPSVQKLQALDASALAIEGLVLARLKFAGSLSESPSDAELSDWQGPRFSAILPGFRPAPNAGEHAREAEGEKKAGN